MLTVTSWLRDAIFLFFLKENVISALRIESSHGNIVEGGSLLGLYTLSTGIYLQH